MLPTRRMSTPVDMLQREIDRAFDRVWGGLGDEGISAAAASYPVDIRETDNEVIVEAELPGFRKDEITVTMEQGVLSLNAQREVKKEEGEGEHHLQERRYSRVSRSFRLPTTVDENEVACTLSDGVLTVRLPKREEVKPRKIEVK